MPIKNPPQPGLLVKDNLDDLSLSVAAAAAGLHVTRQQLYKVIQGQSAITPDMALRLEAAFGGSADWWVRMQAAYELAQVRERKSTPRIERFKPQKVA